MSPQTPQEIIVNILDIIGYGDEKIAFADEFLTLCQQRAVTDLYNSLPQDKRAGKDPGQVIKKIFTPAQSLEAIQKTTEKMLNEYLETIYPKLSEEQTKNLRAYLNSISKG